MDTVTTPAAIAELVVEECIQVVENFAQSLDDGGRGGLEAELAANRIRSRFSPEYIKSRFGSK